MGVTIYNSVHDIEVARLEQKLRKRKYKILINTADKHNIPDLLVVSPKGRIEWIEVESSRHNHKRAKLHDVIETLKKIGGKLRIFYIMD